ncbi:MAG TPA: type II secretion system F family protein [Fimbriimonadaceae bacterium]|nr:type II secretion system F family protein [Fimbriimonadaceae bacterium]HRJ32536.1 type II secretion system F family protein [Fimbriimonadaceae bacterium]
MRQLASQGLRVKTLRADDVRVQSPAQAPAPPRPQPKPQPRPQPVAPRQAVPAPSPSPSPAPASTPRTAPAKPNYRHKTARHRDRWLFFSQLGKMVQAGISPHDALNRLGHQFHHSGFQQFCRLAAPVVAEGQSLSSQFERFPDLFHRGDVGMTRVGEVAGVLPEALHQIAERCRQAHIASRFFFWIFLFLSQAIVGVPLFLLLGRSFGALFEGIAGGFQGDYLAVFRKSIGLEMISGLGLFILVLVLTFTVGMKVWHGYRLRRWRHRLGSWIWHTRSMARAENAESLIWSLTRLTRSGLPPSSAWSLAAESVPNEIYADRYSEVGRRLHERATLGQALGESGAVRPEFISLIQTGEFTGTVPAALDEVHGSLATERSSIMTRMRVSGSISSIFLIILLSCAGFMFFYTEYAHKAMDIFDPARVTDPEYRPASDPRLFPNP